MSPPVTERIRIMIELAREFGADHADAVPVAIRPEA
jgi:hypothetical protein